MAKQMVFTDSCGNTYLESYWKVVLVSFCSTDKVARCDFYGYKDKIARINGKSPIGQKTYPIYSDKYENYFSSILLETNNAVKQCYKICMDYKDIDTGTKDAQGNPIMKSFFEGALDV